jgi:nucleoside-diphosphate-sugar epimerase
MGQRAGAMEGVGVVPAAKPMSVLLTGAAGFFGAHVARLLLDEGHQVTAIVRPGTDPWRIADLKSRLTIIAGELASVGSMRDRIRAQRPDVCIHLAWKGWSGKAEADANMSSLGMSLELLRLMPDLSCGRFVAAGTCFEYDLSGQVLSEASPLRPHDLYGGCKKSLFEVAQEFSALTGVSVVTPRIFYSYGPLEDGRRLVPSIAQALLRGHVAKATAGEQVRDYLHVADIASAIWVIAQSNATGAVNVASGEPVTIAQIATRIADLLGRPELLQLGALDYREGEPMHILGDPRKLRGLGWSPAYSLDSGLASTLEWWQQKVSYA